MKFTKEDACKEIASRISQKGEDSAKWERTIRENVETFFSFMDDDDMELEDFVKKVEPVFSTTLGFMRKTNADTAKEVEARIKALEGNAQQNNNNAPNDKKDDGDDAMKKLLERLEALEKREAENESKKKLSEKRNEIYEKVKGDVKDTKWIDTILNVSKFDENTDTEAFSKELVELYNFSRTDYTDYAPSTPKGYRTQEADFSDIAANIEARRGNLN